MRPRAITTITGMPLLLLLLVLLLSDANGSRLIRSRSDIPIEEDLDQEIKDDLDHFEEIKQV